MSWQHSASVTQLNTEYLQYLLEKTKLTLKSVSVSMRWEGQHIKIIIWKNLKYLAQLPTLSSILPNTLVSFPS